MAVLSANATVMRTIVPAAVALVLAWAVPAGAQTARAHRAVATSSPAAQAQFDSGLTMLYAFNAGQARADFRAAETSDPGCVLCYVGEALSDTIDINHPSSSEGEQRGADAVARARAHAAGAPEDERAILAAVAQRFAPNRPLKAKYQAYFAAMQRYADAHPADAFGFTQAAYAGWNATDGFTSGGALTADARTLARDLDAALEADPADIGAHHLRIHFWEFAGHPERALADADYLNGLAYAPGESHLPHMAGHTYSRVGDYAAVVSSNETACANDADYFKLGDGPGQAYMRTYHDHDVDFVLYGLSTLGRDADARAFAAHESVPMQIKLLTRLHANNAVLALAGSEVTPARVIAEARLGDLPAAQRDAAALRSMPEFAGQADIAEAALDRAKHDAAAAVALLRKARAAAGDYPGDPKTDWQFPPGEAEAAILLESGKADEAEAAFRRELGRFPGDPRLEFGLAEALKAQNKDDTAVRAAAAAGWKGERPLTRADLG